ncbi:uncharacterized protein LOC117118385 [Anneissia japonica]|uniref:uncharacterized protein LOC117118385 n=1 Tax=Anneissia japonica TaxID=1529436 RepID=UPI001425936B|nr:uncharacterized protein LOC117118385 [Anneissia japonica]
MEEKANSFDPPCTYKQLKMFLDSMRSQVGKITKRKSGQGTQLMSDRDAWVVQTFGFLEKHIVRIPSRPTSKFPDIKTSDSMAIPSGGDDDDDEKEEEEDNRQGDSPHAMEKVSTDSISDEAGTRGKVKNKSRPKCKATKTKESEVLGKLLTRADELAKIRNALAKEMSPHEQQVETYMGYMKTQIQLIPCENWYQFTIDNMRLDLKSDMDIEKHLQKDGVDYIIRC